MAGFVVAVTGGVASGKSAVTARFALLGVAIADADIAARTIVGIGQPALSQIISRFGPRALMSDGTLDRASMRKIVFNDEQARRDLEAILHPQIRELLEHQCRSAEGRYAIVAIPLLVESIGLDHFSWVQRTLVVDVPTMMQRARLIARDGIESALAERMISSQVSRSQRLRAATDVIVNDGDLTDVAGPVGRLHAFYTKLAST